MKSASAAALVLLAACGGAAPATVTAPVVQGQKTDVQTVVLAPPPPSTAAPGDTSSDATDDGDTPDGIPVVCDAFFARLAACLRGTSTAPMIDAALKTMRDAWRAAAKDPAQRAGIATVCTEATKQFGAMYPACH